ncbi:MAG TPA: Ig-like domain-containing protein, partial [Mucilaginibacter sp.]|nr:Ig-like domain-containing protein [Mucilaginibacter sp.]
MPLRAEGRFFYKTHFKIILILLLTLGGYAISHAQSPLCSSGPTMFGYEYVSSVTINGSTVQGATGYSGPGYFDQTGSSLTTLTAGNTYNVSVTVNTNGAYQEYVKIWIDYNGNGDLQDAGELVFDQNYTFTGTQVYSGTVTIPTTAFNGPVYIRTILVYSSSPTICGSYDYGATIDCKATITGGLTPQKLTVATSGTGSVVSNPAGIITASSYNYANFAQGSNVTLTATPGGSESFAGWTGSVTSSSNPLTVTMDADKSITAIFATAPVLTTTAVSGATATTATSGGDITSDGGSSVTARGVCWNTTGSPTTSDSKTTDGTGTGTFTSSLTGLSPATTYYVRAYATNGVSTTYGNAVTFTTSANPPTTISSITLTGSSPTNSSSVQYTVTFGASITGLTASNFSLTTGGTLTGTGITSVSGSGTTYTVTVNTGSGDGNLTLNLANATGLTPGISTTLPFAGQSYDVDRTASTLSITSDKSQLKAGETATITFTFSEDPGTTFDITDVLVAGGTLGSLSGSGATRTAVFTPDANTNNGTASITVAAGSYQDAAGNNGGAGITPALNYDTQVPTVSSINTADVNPTAATSVNYTVTFSEAVTGVDATDFTVSNTSGTATGTVSSVTGTGNTYTVTVNNVTGSGGLRLDLNSGGTGITDAAGNAVSGGYTTGQSYTIGHGPASISFVAIPNKTYGDADFAPGATSTNTGTPITYTSSNTSVATIVSGNIHIIGAGTTTITASQAAGNGYDAATDQQQTLTVNPAAITITADAKIKVYGQSDPALTYQVTSGALVGSDAFTGSLTRDPGENVGSYAINQGTLALNSNYTLSYISANLSITTA